jgi:hypothetical protein
LPASAAELKRASAGFLTATTALIGAATTAGKFVSD